VAWDSRLKRELLPFGYPFGVGEKMSARRAVQLRPGHVVDGLLDAREGVELDLVGQGGQLGVVQLLGHLGGREVILEMQPLILSSKLKPPNRVSGDELFGRSTASRQGQCQDKRGRRSCHDSLP